MCHKIPEYQDIDLFFPGKIFHGLYQLGQDLPVICPLQPVDGISQGCGGTALYDPHPHKSGKKVFSDKCDDFLSCPFIKNVQVKRDIIITGTSHCLIIEREYCILILAVVDGRCLYGSQMLPGADDIILSQ